MTESMNGKTVLVTGATDGIGKETALRLAGMGARVLISGRNPQKGAAAAADIARATGRDAPEFLKADLSSQADIRALAAAVKERTSRLDVLINNAGAIVFGRQETVDGIEMTFGLNHLNYFLLTNELIDLLKASAPARIVSVASIAHRRAALDFNDLELKGGYSAWKAYSRSKLANVMFTYELARRSREVASPRTASTRASSVPTSDRTTVCLDVSACRWPCGSVARSR